MLVTSKTPLRVSFFGGGTDYPEYFNEAGGSVIGMAIDKYIYISALKLRSFIDYRFRFAYSKLETVRDAAELQHPVLREVLRYYNIEQPLDFSILSDLPARTGLGSSSTFTVGLLNLVNALRQHPMTKIDLAETAIHVERNILQERVGVQDQYHAAFGGMNRFDFEKSATRITPVRLTGQAQTTLLSSMVLIYTGGTRFASEVLKEQMSNLSEGKISTELSDLRAMVDEAQSILEGNPETLVSEFGKLMHQGWQLKQRLSSKVSSDAIGELYNQAMSAGAIGGKLCGAGGGGFLLMIIPEHQIAAVEAAVSPAPLIRLGIDTHGSQIIHHSAERGVHAPI